jgi:hypothetical protein
MEISHPTVLQGMGHKILAQYPVMLHYKKGIIL